MKQKQNFLEKHPGWHLTKKERRDYYVGDMARRGITQILVVFMTTFLLFKGVNVMGLAGVTALVKVIDAFDDVLFGFLVDRLNLTEWKLTKKLAGEGKYMPWYRTTFFFLPIAVILFFLMPDGLPDAGKLAWYLVTYLLYDFTCTLSEVPMNSMIITLTDNVDERNDILNKKMIFSTVFTLVLAFGMPVLISEYVGLPVSQVAIALAVIGLIFMIPMAKNVKEYNPELKNSEGEEEKKYTFKDMLRCVKTNKYMTIYLLYDIVTLLSSAGSAVGLFVSYYLYHNSVISTLIVAIALIPGLIMQGFTNRVQKKLGRRNLLIYTTLLIGLGNLVLYFVGYSNIAWVVVIGIVGGIFNFPRAIVVSFLVPDTIEYTRYKTGENCSGIFYALVSFVEKAVNGIASSLGLALMGLFGFQAVNATSFADLEGVTQPASALTGMWLLSSLFPAMCYILGTVILAFYNLKDKDAQLMAQCNAGEITREECEQKLSKKY